LSDVAAVNRVGPWWTGNGQKDSDDRVAFSFQSVERLQDVAVLFKSATGHLPTLDELNFFSTSAASDRQLAQQAVDYIFHNTPGLAQQSLEAQVRSVITQVWGNGAASEALVPAGVQYFNDGGNWADGALFLARAAQGLNRIADPAGKLNLTQTYNTGESGWSADTGNDILRGGAGNDRLVGGQGNDLLDGGAGTDIAVFTGNVADYLFRIHVSGSEKQLLLINKSSGETDTLQGVEWAQIGSHYYGPNATLGALNLPEDVPYELKDFVVDLTQEQVQLVGLAPSF